MIHVRHAGGLDARPMVDLLNEVIQIGGATAMVSPVNSTDFANWIAKSQRSAWFVAEDAQGALLGFQWIEQVPELPPEAAEIATFTRIGKTGIGVGSALFLETCKAAKVLGYRWIRANIRADNDGGLAYYQSRGFEDYARLPNVRLSNGQVVDKILKRFEL